MSIENVQKFYEAVSQDKELQQKFIELSKKYQGQQIDEAKSMAIMAQEGLPLAKQLGYDFTLDDLKAYGNEKQPTDISRELSDEELQAVTGGAVVTYCCFCGVNSQGDIFVTGGDFCFFLGFNVNFSGR